MEHLGHGKVEAGRWKKRRGPPKAEQKRAGIPSLMDLDKQGEAPPWTTNVLLYFY